MFTNPSPLQVLKKTRPTSLVARLVTGLQRATDHIGAQHKKILRGAGWVAWTFPGEFHGFLGKMLG